MKSTMKCKMRKQISFEDAEKMLMDALKAEPKDLKVPISVRLDGDIYLELKRLAEAGLGDGKYQGLLNQILRHHLFGESRPALPRPRRKAVAG